MGCAQFSTRLGVILLLTTGVLKFAEALQQHHYFKEPDSVMPFLTNRQLLVMAGVFECVVGAYAWFTASFERRSFALLWFCNVVAVYKIGRYFTRATYPCSCLGILEKWLNLTWKQTDILSWVVLAFLAISSIACLVQGNRNSLTAAMKPR